MKFSLNPLPQAKKFAIEQINGYFAAQTDPHRDQAHRRKREIAALVTDGATPPAAFAEEAALRKLTAKKFAKLIAGKPDPFDQRELKRQKLLFAVENATNMDVIREALNGLSEV